MTFANVVDMASKQFCIILFITDLKPQNTRLQICKYAKLFSVLSGGYALHIYFDTGKHPGWIVSNLTLEYRFLKNIHSFHRIRTVNSVSLAISI